MDKLDEKFANKHTVSLRKLCEKDAEKMLEWMHDPEINQYYRFDAKNMNIGSVLDFIASAQEFGTSRHYAIVGYDDEYLGTISLKNIDETNRKAEYAVVIRKKYQGKGVSRFATDEILKIAFGELSLNRIYLNVLEDNKRANGFYRKYGFVYEGFSRKDVYIRGGFYDLAWYSILKEDYTKRADDN